MDTDVLIDVAVGVEVAKTHLLNLELAVSAVTHMELVVGCRNKRELNLLEAFLAALLKRYRLGHGLLIPDVLIAATAVTSGAPLSSKNQQDCRFIEGLELPYPS